MKRAVDWAFMSLSLVLGALLLFIGLVSIFGGVCQFLLPGQDPLDLLFGVVICLAFTALGVVGIALPVSRIIRMRRER